MTDPMHYEGDGPVPWDPRQTDWWNKPFMRLYRVYLRIRLFVMGWIR